MSARFTFLFALVLHVLHLMPSMAMAETVSIRADHWLPFNGNPDSGDPGYMIELADIILSDNGHTMDYKSMLWLRSLEAVRKGKIDCVVGAFIDDAPDFIFPEESWGYSVDTFYVKNDSTWNYEGIESLRDVKLGIVGGYAYSPELDVYIEKYKLNRDTFILDMFSQHVGNSKAVIIEKLNERSWVIITKNKYNISKT